LPIKRTRWRNLQTVWAPPDGLVAPHASGTLVRITDPSDLIQWGQMMRHSGGRYRKWVVDTPIWAFLTFIDVNGKPFVTVHAKKVEWWCRTHPDDALAVERWPWGFGPCPVDEDGKAQFWVPSTAYESLAWRYRESTVMLGDEEFVIMAAGHRDADPLLESERVLLDKWYQEVRTDRAS
jgi:hypothetical protein